MPHSLSHSAMNLYCPLRQMFYELMGSQICSKPIPINASLTLSHPLPFMVHALAFKAILPVTYGVQITPRRLCVQKSSWSRFRMSYRRDVSSRSHLSRKIYSVPQSALHQSKQGGEPSSISLLQRAPPSTMAFPRNMVHLSMKLLMTQFPR